jgi:regulator of sigma E protease
LIYIWVMGISAFVLTLVPVVVVHELGHFLFCKLFGVYVKTFSIGIGPKILRKRWGETEYVISAIPFGGYVKMAGEGMMEEIQDTGTWEERKYPLGTVEGNKEAAGLDDDIPPERHFFNKPAWQRGLVFVAGPLFNVVLAFILFTGLVFVTGREYIPSTTIGMIHEGTPAAESGFQVGDRLLTVDGLEVDTWGEALTALLPLSAQDVDKAQPITVTVDRDGLTETLELKPVSAAEYGFWTNGLEVWGTTVGQVQKGGKAAELGLLTGDEIETVDGQVVRTFGAIARIINDAPGREIELTWKRDGQLMSGMVVPQLVAIDPSRSVGRISISRKLESERIGIIESCRLGYQRTWYTIRDVVSVLRDGIRGRLGLDAVGGPVRIGQAAGEMLRWGFSRLVYFVAFFSVNLFLLNLLPIPVLDGGHVLFLIFEVLRGGKPVPERMQAIATQIGLIILLIFMTFVIVLDVWKVSGH